ncbi:MAG: hypothetical protein IIC50_14715 [Planctomycetes bacterium]|nr:hypothetical protein [Planctomycetota bacterium]
MRFCKQASNESRSSHRGLAGLSSLLTQSLGLSLMVFLSNGISFAHDMVPGIKQHRPIALRGGTIHTVSGETIASGTLLFEEGKIVALGTKVAIPQDCQVIDIEGKHDVAVSYQLYLGGVQVGGLQQAFNCEDDTDCGPDSSDGDNFRVIIADAVFDRIDLIVTSTEGGEFSLNGGADGTEPGPLGDFLHTNDSLFHITDVENVTCNTAATPLGEEGGPQGTFFLANCGGATGKSIAFEADTANNEVTITNVGAGIPGAYTLETWTFLPVPTTAVLRYDDGDGEFLAQFCLIDPRNPDGITVPDGIDTNTVLPLIEQTNGRHTTCVVQETKTTLGQFDFGTGIKAKFILFSTGDATRSFR